MSLDRPLLRVRGLTKRYGGQMGCLDVGFDLWPEEVVGIVGESGSGKTTVLLLDEPTASLDTASRALVVQLIHEARTAGAALLGTVHDPLLRREIASRVVTLHGVAA